MATATERYVGARGHARQVGTTLGRTTMGNHPSSLIICRLGATAVTTPSDNVPSLAPPESHNQPRGITPPCIKRVGRDCPERGAVAGPAPSTRPGTGQVPMSLTAPLPRTETRFCRRHQRSIRQAAEIHRVPRCVCVAGQRQGRGRAELENGRLAC